jgi:ADP-ribosylglycohydrolase
MAQRTPNTQERIARAIQSLQRLSCGDAFGERFFVHPDILHSLVANRAVPSPPWRYTDDTAMAIGIVETLEEFGEIREHSLAENFGRRFLTDPHRGYGAAMHSLLPDLADTPSLWKEKSESLFRGAGSFGNGAAMRVAPLGAYFADDFDAVVSQAEYSAVVTHSHPEGVAGAIAVATAAALACEQKNTPMKPIEFLEKIARLTPSSDVQLGIMKALALAPDTTAEAAVAALGNGAKISAQDTVPFSLWAAAHHLDDYESALWTTVSGRGDIDTNCAIVGGIVVMSAGVEFIPPAWIQAREPLPAWFLYPEPDQN